MVDVLRLDNDTAIVPQNIVKVELRDVNLSVAYYMSTTRNHEWHLIIHTTGGAEFVLAREHYSYAGGIETDYDWDTAEKASKRAKDKLIMDYERVLAAVQDS
jgi:hypothetical protein